MKPFLTPTMRRLVRPSGDEALWFKDAIIYEVHVRAFADSNGDGIGDFAGLTEKLDYLHDLGVTALWLLPFYPSPLRDGGYDIADYTGVHPDYGSKEDFLRFLEAAHRRDIKVITELVINHTSIEHGWFQRARRAAPGSPERDFYVWSDTPERYTEARIIFRDFETSNWTWDPVAKAYYWHRFYSHQPDLNFDNPAVHEALFEVLDHWMQIGVDGVRLDAVPYLYEREGTSCENLPETHEFLRKVRAHVDEKFQNRMLLAEANQWPVDAAAYFGQGDECHMNFHFPLMPRLFMAVDLEDSFPLVDILAQTPSIPDNCQWATFLRNHDELTLEMVTEEERDYMYRVYAPELRAKLNLGIRRRLAPLLRDRRRLELLNAILFSLPGTPVIYYGDEIGMGDNIYLGDRDGVRTPMQWNPDRNAGFSRANPQRLYLPLVVDPHYHYEAVNVEAHQANPASLLWWMKHLIALRRSTQIFGRGKLTFVQCENPKVLAFVRELGDERVLFVANLSRFPQHGVLLLAAWSGLDPVEMLGRSRFPRIEGERWGLSLGPYDYFWFELAPSEQREARSFRPLRARGSWWRVAQESAEELAERLAWHIESKRWFRGKGRQRVWQEVRDVITIEGQNERFLLVLVQLTYGSSAPQTYVVPVGFVQGAAAQELDTNRSPDVIASLVVEGEQEELGVLVDATSLRSYASRLLTALGGGERLAGTLGSLRCTPRASLENAVSSGSTAPRHAELDQTNSLIFYGTQLALKVQRVIDEGPSAEVEMLQFLNARSQRRLVPRLMGTLEWVPPEGQPALVGLATELVANRGSAWALFADALRSYFERVLALDDPQSPGSLAASLPPSLLAEGPPPDLTAPASDEAPPARWSALIDALPSLVALLGRRTAEMHLTLLSGTDLPEFAPEPFNVLHQQSLYQSARTLLSRTSDQLRQRMAKLPEAARGDAARFVELTPRIDRLLRDVVSGQLHAVRIRSHGDLHLGQVLFTGDDYVFLDFEGEPARLLRERRYKRCPLRDVAGMLRSFEYAAEAALHAHVRQGDVAMLSPWAWAWVRWMSLAFVRCYSEQASGTPLWPSREHTRRLLRFYLLDKCIYEIDYELNNRPDWVGVPLAGALRLVSQENP